jgi:hypothetical protein
VAYRAELSARALKQLQGLPGPVFDDLIVNDSTETVVIFDISWIG